jgi:hypothetical protein
MASPDPAPSLVATMGSVLESTVGRLIRDVLAEAAEYDEAQTVGISEGVFSPAAVRK